MASSFYVDTKRLQDKWRGHLRSINFWLNGYLNSHAYRNMEGKLTRWWVLWNVGVGPTCCFTRTISRMTVEANIKEPYDHVIEVDMKRAAAELAGAGLSISDMLTIEVADKLGLLDQEYMRQKSEGYETWYYSYGNQNSQKVQDLLRSIVPQIIQKLLMKKYLLVVENLGEPIKPIKLDVFTEGLSCLPPPMWKNSFWHASTTSKDVYDKSKPDYPCLIDPFSGDDIVILILRSLHQASKYILGAIGHKDERYWHHRALQCFQFATMLLVPHCSLPIGEIGGQQSSAALADITSEDLIRQWAAQGILVMDQIREATTNCDGKYNDIFQVGNVILEAFGEYSLLQLPFSPATEADGATKSAAHFLAYHNLVADSHTTDELCEGDHPELGHMQWISHVGDQGWHLSRELLDRQTSGPTALILRHCSQQSRLLAKLDHLLAKLPYLRVLDLSYSSVESLAPSIFCLQRLQLLYLSYTPLKSLPPSIYRLQNLQFLSLRGCYNITSPFGFLDTGTITLTENNNNTEIGLLHLDLSHSTVKTFHCDFFRRMPNLQELLLLKCSNLEELPPSIASLSSLEKLELTGTQVKSFPVEIFGEMKNLRSLKLIENKKFLFAPGLFSEASGLVDLHIEGCESITEVEVNLERHPTLRLFSFIGASHMKRLSLHGCRNLEYIDIKEAGSLEELNLSATAIMELPDSIPNLPQLRRLLLLGVPSLRRFPWHKLQRLPDVFCLDQCSNSTINHSDCPQGAQVCVSDSRLFYSFNQTTRDLVKAGKLLKTFYVRVTSCKAASSSKLKDEGYKVMTNTLQLAPAAYDDINHQYLTDGVSMVSMDDVPPCVVTERHVEISAADRYPHGLNYLLRVTKSISMWDDTHVSCLNDLSGLDELEECKLQRCHKTVHVFSGEDNTYSMRYNMKNAFVSHLRSLTHFYYALGYRPFYALKHLILEYCPRLEAVVPRVCELQELETLDIHFCYNLKAIFYDNGYSSSDGYELPDLRRISLQELPLLEHLHIDNPKLTAPAWKELHVRGCWSLRSLPRFRQQPDKAVEVSGERAWWDKLRWDQDSYAPLHRDSYEPMLPPAFASRRERVVIESYLR